jgi:hypothetical protein
MLKGTPVNEWDETWLGVSTKYIVTRSTTGRVPAISNQ